MRTRMQEPVVLNRDCPAVHIPSGETGTLPEGTLVTITQDLGGSFTVHAGGNLYRIAGADADALGREPLPQPILPDDADDDDVAALVWAQMETCYDPEIPINLVELGLIYDCRISKVGDNQRRVDVQMTLTAPAAVWAMSSPTTSAARFCWYRQSSKLMSRWCSSRRGPWTACRMPRALPPA